MADVPAEGFSQVCAIRGALSFEDARQVWWPLMQNLGWNRGLEDGETHFHSAGPSAWLHLIPPDTNSPEGCIVPFAFDNGTGWVGFFCINADYRGKGYGRSLFKACMDHLTSQAVRFVGLDAVTEQKSTYERRGFVDQGTVRLMQRRSICELPQTENNLRPDASAFEEDCTIVDIKTLDPRDLLEDDLACTGLQRSRLWTKEALLDRADVFGYAIRTDQERSSLQGWIVVRSCPEGYRFGPLYADNAELACLLLVKALSSCTGDGKMIAEIWMGNRGSERVFEDCGWTATGTDYHRMWLNGCVPSEQKAGGRAEKSMFAIFDAAQG